MAPDVIILISLAFNDRSQRLHDRFDAHIRDTGELLCRATRQPLLDCSRALLARGCNETDIIGMVWAHAPQTIAMTAVIGQAARYDVLGGKFVKRKPSSKPSPMSEKEE